jgi:S-adenosylhomocysteine hydrolase
MIWQIMWEQEPKRGDIIIRTCGNRWCVSPDHIEKKESRAVYTAA